MKTPSSVINRRLVTKSPAYRALYLVPTLLIAGCVATSTPTKRAVVPVSECKSIEACITYVRESVSRQWIRPSEFTYPSKVQLKVELDSSAAVQRVEIAASSGNALFDTSAVEAVQRAKGFPGLKGIDSKTFEKTFKKFFFDFSPDATLEVSGSDRAAYDAAFELLKIGKYKEGAAAFSEFVEEYPTSPLVDHGFYWLGESCYVLRDYARATAAFQTVLEKFRHSRKVPDSLLRVGDVSYKLGEYVAARRSLERLVGEFAGTEPANLGEQRLAKMKSEGR